jgi:hypothetical protein
MACERDTLPREAEKFDVDHASIDRKSEKDQDSEGDSAFGLLIVSPEAYAEILAMVSAPATVVPAIVENARRRAPWEAGDEDLQ